MNQGTKLCLVNRIAFLAPAFCQVSDILDFGKKILAQLLRHTFAQQFSQDSHAMPQTFWNEFVIVHEEYPTPSLLVVNQSTAKGLDRYNRCIDKCR